MLEKRNVVDEERTPCSVCAGGSSEHVCPKCKGVKQAEESTRLDPEKLAKEHQWHGCRFGNRRFNRSAEGVAHDKRNW